MAQRAAALRDAAREQLKRNAAADEARNRLLKAQRLRRLAIDLQWQRIKLRQMHERKVLLAWILAEQRRQIARRHWQAVGLAMYVKRIAALRVLLRHYEAQRRRQQKSMEEFHKTIETAMKRRHANEAAEAERLYQAIRRLERHELKCLNQGQLAEIGWHRSWIARNDGDFDGVMRIGKTIARTREQRSAGFDQLGHLRQRFDIRWSAGNARLERTLAYMKENGIEITSDPASKWLPLQRKRQSEGLANGLAMALGLNKRDVTGRSAQTKGRTHRIRDPAPLPRNLF